MATCGRAAGTRAQMRSRARKEASAQEVEDTTNSLLKRNIWSTDPGLATRFFDLIDMRKFKPRKYVTGRWVLTIKTDKQDNSSEQRPDWY